MASCRLDSLILKYDKQIPRYTSYPTAPHFNSRVDSEVYTGWLASIPKQETLSLYFHIPFCYQLCWYCGCYTKATQRYEPIENYLQLLLKEIRLISKSLAFKEAKVSHIHFGGGSPTILLPNDFKNLMDETKSQFNILQNAEIAIEVDPRNIDENKVATYVKSGINRVSIGVQDFNYQVQLAINREQSFDSVYSCIRLFRKYGVNNINLDLIYGLPRQTVEMVKRNIDYSLILNPSRIALFAYAHVKWIKKHMRLIDEQDLPDSKDRLRMYKAASKRLREDGYLSVGLDHFAKTSDTISSFLKEKKLKRNFQGYSTDEASTILGFGASAISYLPFGYAQNTLDFKEYEENILAGIAPVKKGFKLRDGDRIRKRVIDEIMCFLEVDLNEVCKSFGFPEDYFSDEIRLLDDLERDKLIKIKNNKIVINPRTRQAARIVSSFFDKFFQDNQIRHSKAL